LEIMQGFASSAAEQLRPTRRRTRRRGRSSSGRWRRTRNFGLAYAMLAWTHAFDAMSGWGEDRRTSLDRARELAS
jgi:hypothetical protein